MGDSSEKTLELNKHYCVSIGICLKEKDGVVEKFDFAQRSDRAVEVI